MQNCKITKIHPYKNTQKFKLPLYLTKISAGFPSPAKDYIEKKLDLNEYLIKHPAATFFLKVEGTSMINAGINSGDILIVDRSLEIKNNHIAVILLNGEFNVKKIQKKDNRLFLQPQNDSFK
ncbi:MAG: translesion error-prone DNA polymerase V autoproteolytic subunit, partial [Candidatus Moranbacteria bacterium]|nr:translesion error-prone DNA polymerase V autoproteolytic subunit [Candidatus Moranbacteria bacterium]